jgi:hypothetical protein
MVLMATCAVDRLIHWTWNRNCAALRWLIVPVTGLAIAAPLFIQREYFFCWSAWRHVRELYGPELFAESGQIAKHLALNTSSDEPIYIYGSEPQIYFLAQRRCASRYAFIPPLTARGERAARRQHEAFEQLVRSRPAFLLLVTIPMSHLKEPNASEFLTSGPSGVSLSVSRPIDTARKITICRSACPETAVPASPLTRIFKIYCVH